MDDSQQQSSIVHRPSSDALPNLSVVIVSWNVRELLAQCLRALLSEEVRSDLRLEIIVVDNASSDGSAAEARAFEGVRVIETGRNLGYGKANNLGFDVARGRCLLVLNPDTIPQPGSLQALLAFAQSHPGAGLVSPRLLNRDGSVQPAAFRFPTLAMAALDLFPMPAIAPGRFRVRIAQSRLNGRYPQEAAATKPFRVDHPLGACMLVNCEAYRQLGGFDPAIYMYSEEIDLALRYARAGWERWQVPEARVVHLGGQSTRQTPNRMFVELWRSRLYIYSRYHTRAGRAALVALLVISQLWEVMKTLWALIRREIERQEAQRKWRRAGAALRLVLKR